MIGIGPHTSRGRAPAAAAANPLDQRERSSSRRGRQRREQLDRRDERAWERRHRRCVLAGWPRIRWLRMARPARILHAPTNVGNQPYALSRAERDAGLRVRRRRLHPFPPIRVQADVIHDLGGRPRTCMLRVRGSFLARAISRYDVFHYNWGQPLCRCEQLGAFTELGLCGGSARSCSSRSRAATSGHVPGARPQPRAHRRPLAGTRTPPRCSGMPTARSTSTPTSAPISRRAFLPYANVDVRAIGSRRRRSATTSSSRTRRRTAT